jgi:ferritin
MLNEKIAAALNLQVKLEAQSSQFYLSMASWSENHGLNGTAEFLFRHSDEERQHMLKLVRFINERGGNSVIPALPAPKNKFSGLHGKHPQGGGFVPPSEGLYDAPLHAMVCR